jgi:hypothetical protein
MCAFCSDHGPNENPERFYQTTRMSLTDLKPALEDKGKCQLAYNARVVGKVDARPKASGSSFQFSDLTTTEEPKPRRRTFLSLFVGLLMTSVACSGSLPWGFPVFKERDGCCDVVFQDGVDEESAVPGKVRIVHL